MQKEHVQIGGGMKVGVEKNVRCQWKTGHLGNSER